MAAGDDRKEPVFKELRADEPDIVPTEIESMCVNCGENGITKLLLTKIPHYREVIIMSFRCDWCGYQNNEIQSGSQVQEQGVSYKVKIQTAEDLSRQIVKSDYATFTVPEIDLEIPPSSQKGAISTVEGVLRRTISGLAQDQPVRRHLNPEDAEQIDEYIKKIETLIELSEPFHVVLTDPSGNSFLENPHAPKSDPFREFSHFLRTREQDHDLGIYTADEVASKEAADDDAAAAEDTELSSTTSSTLLLRCQEGEVTSCSEEASSLAEQPQKIDGREATGTQPEVALPRVLSATEAMEAASAVSTTTPTTSDKQHGSSKLTEDLREEVLNFPTNCPECGAPADTKMKLTNIPHFKEVVIMATVCEYCGHKTNEVKSGGGIEPKGKRIILQITDPSDLTRDILKSETCSLAIPELEFEMGVYALGGRFTTLEGLLVNIKEQVETNPLFGATAAIGDSAVDAQKAKIEKFKNDLDALAECKTPFKLILDDPAGNSYIQNTYAPDPDPEMQIEEYERTYDQNEDLGLNDMNTDDYQEP